MTTIDISILAVVLAALVFFLINAAHFKKQNLFLSQLPQYPTLFKTPTLSTVSEDCLV